MPGFSEYDAYDALGLAELVKSGQVQSAELVEECIARTERINPELNAIVRTLYDMARDRAAQVPSDGVFAGVPFFVKDLIQCIPGVPTEMGSRFWQGWTPQNETTLYRRWLDAGLVPVAKTATPELGLLPITEPEVNGPTRNPWHVERTCGGSSGGAAASVAAGVLPMASAGDGGGSIRIPASCCGLFGHKPSRARTPAGPFVSEHWSGFAVEHVVAKTVRDSAAMLDATHGPEETAAYYAPHVEGTFLGATERDPQPLRIGFHCEPTMPGTVHADCKAALEDAAKLCEVLGHRVEEISPQHDQEALGRAFIKVLGGNFAAEVVEGERIRGRRATRKDFELTTWLTHMVGRAITAQDFVLAERTLQAESRRLVRIYRDFDLVLTPTLGRPPVRIGELDATGVDAVGQKLIAAADWTSIVGNPSLIDRTAETTFDFVPFTPLANFTGWPAMSVPLFWNDEGLPIGVMFLGRPEQESLMFTLAAQLERARPWKDRRPPVYA